MQKTHYNFLQLKKKILSERTPPDPTTNIYFPISLIQSKEKLSFRSFVYPLLQFPSFHFLLNPL